jgi:hypothetical protein
LRLRGSSIVAPFALAILIWRDRLLPPELLSGTATMLRTGLVCLPVDAGVAFAGALFLVTALAVLRFALSD